MESLGHPPVVGRIGHVALRTADLDRSTWFWKEVVGLEEVERTNEALYLRAWGESDHHSLVLIADDAGGVDHVSWRAASPKALTEAADRLREQGAEVAWLEAGEESGQGDAIRFRSPDGHAFEIYFEMDRPPAGDGLRSRMKTNSSHAWSRGISPRRIDHVNVTAPSPAETSGWLTEVLGLRTRETIRGADGDLAAVWMGASALSHDIAAMGAPPPASAGFHHIAYYLDDAQDVLRAADILREKGISIDGGPGRHGVSQAIFLYARDPGSGHRLELFSGGYLVLDPDWEPVEWAADELAEAMAWWGPSVAELPAMEPTTSYATAVGGD